MNFSERYIEKPFFLISHMHVTSILAVFWIILGILFLIAGVWVDFLLSIQALFGTTLSGGSGTQIEPTWITFTLWGGITATGIALILIGRRIKSSTNEVKEDRFSHSLDHFH